MKYSLILAVFFSWFWTSGFTQNIEIGGIVSSGESEESLAYATILVEGSSTGAYTDEKGRFNLKVSRKYLGDSIYLLVAYSGFERLRFFVDLSKGNQTNLKIQLRPKKFREVQVIGIKDEDSARVQRNQMSAVKLEMKEIEHLPAIGGEVDIIKAVQLLPGISGGVEGTVGLLVRGGNADQNLVMMDKAPIYEFGHLFGFYSVFNIDAVKSVEMIKGGFPAEFGGRLSSILDIEMDVPDDNKFHMKGGIGLLSSRLTLGFPIVKDKVHLSLSGRRTYIDNVARLAALEVPYYFYDLNGKLSAKLSEKDKLYVSSYLGKDVLYEPAVARQGGAGDFGFDKRNWVTSVRWQRVLNENSTLNTYGYTTLFDYDVFGQGNTDGLSVVSSIKDYGLKSEFKQYLNDRASFVTGIEFIHHDFKPNVINARGEVTEFVETSSGEALGFQEFALFGDYEFHRLNSRLTFKPGLRISGALVKNKLYMGIEPRLSTRYTLTDQSSVKFSYSRMMQYIHRVSSSAVALPTDMWYPVTNGVEPQAAHQIALGYEYYARKIKTTFSIEGYAKWMNRMIEYREGTNLFLNNDFEEELVQGRGNAQGIEFLMKRNAKKLNGWLAYTLSWSKRNFEELNGGSTYFARYDRRHDISLTLDYAVTPRFHISTIWVYATGSRITPQTGNYILPNTSGGGIQLVPIYPERNSVKMSATHRLDINLVFKGKYKPDKKWQGEFHLGVYNVYHRTSPQTISLNTGPNGGLIYEQPGLFGFLPSIAYNFKFN